MNCNDRLFPALMMALLMVLLPFEANAAPTRGDVDGDGRVTVADVAALINGLLNSGTDVTGNVAANVNDDGSVSTADVAMLINYLLGGVDLPPIMPEPEVFTVNDVSFYMIPVEGGTFTMGATAEQGSDPSDREKPAHQVTVSSYYIGQTEVTQALWQAVMEATPSYFTGDTRPVEQVSWEDCQLFIARLNQLTGRDFRLPTEAEWEFAARGGNASEGYKYSGSDDLAAVGWYSYNDAWEAKGGGAYGTHAVATRNPNELMLFDMSGNVHEWCEDWYGSYSSADQVDPTGPSTGTNRVYRGGS